MAASLSFLFVFPLCVGWTIFSQHGKQECRGRSHVQRLQKPVVLHIYLFLYFISWSVSQLYKVHQLFYLSLHKILLILVWVSRFMLQFPSTRAPNYLSYFRPLLFKVCKSQIRKLFGFIPKSQIRKFLRCYWYETVAKTANRLNINREKSLGLNVILKKKY